MKRELYQGFCSSDWCTKAAGGCSFLFSVKHFCRRTSPCSLSTLPLSFSLQTPRAAFPFLIQLLTFPPISQTQPNPSLSLSLSVHHPHPKKKKRKEKKALNPLVFSCFSPKHFTAAFLPPFFSLRVLRIFCWKSLTDFSSLSIGPSFNYKQNPPCPTCPCRHAALSSIDHQKLPLHDLPSLSRILICSSSHCIHVLSSEALIQFKLSSLQTSLIIQKNQNTGPSGISSAWAISS